VTRTIALDVRDVRTASAVLLCAAVAVPFLPEHDAVVCPLRAVTGIPCPLCGMTTSVTNTVRLDLVDAIAASPAGVAAVVAAVAILALRPRRLAVPAVIVPLVLVAMWVWQLARFSVI
jgi:hypothetical protein